jgi:hypothetical protein
VRAVSAGAAGWDKAATDIQNKRLLQRKVRFMSASAMVNISIREIYNIRDIPSASAVFMP